VPLLQNVSKGFFWQMNFLQFWNKFFFQSGFQNAIETPDKLLLKSEEACSTKEMGV
jgi:hypothetical protein